eukprot:sb/3469864/
MLNVVLGSASLTLSWRDLPRSLQLLPPPLGQQLSFSSAAPTADTCDDVLVAVVAVVVAGGVAVVAAGDGLIGSVITTHCCEVARRSAWNVPVPEDGPAQQTGERRMQPLRRGDGAHRTGLPDPSRVVVGRRVEIENLGGRGRDQEPTETSKQPIRTRYLGHVTGYQPTRGQYFLIRSVPAVSVKYNNRELTLSMAAPPLPLALLQVEDTGVKPALTSGR